MHEQLVALFHLFRIVSGFLAIQATYDFLALFLRHARWRRTGLVLASLGGGLGWILLFMNWLLALLANTFASATTGSGSLPLDFYSPESFGFLSLYGLPHLALARALLLGGLVHYLARRKIPAGALWLLLGLVQPLYVPIAWAVVGGHLALLGIWQAWRQRQGWRVDWLVCLRDPGWRGYLRRAVVDLLLSSPLVIYTLLSSQADPFFRSWTAQNLILSPPPLDYFLAYGLPGLIFLAGLPLLWKQRWLEANDLRFPLPIAWALILPVLVYAPYNLQRRLAEGAWVALVALALASLEARPRRRLQAVLFLLLPPTFLLWAAGILGISLPGRPLYRPASETAAFECDRPLRGRQRLAGLGAAAGDRRAWAGKHWPGRDPPAPGAFLPG
jgi:hypothetical protein